MTTTLRFAVIDGDPLLGNLSVRCPWAVTMIDVVCYSDPSQVYPIQVHVESYPKRCVLGCVILHFWMRAT